MQCPSEHTGVVTLNTPLLSLTIDPKQGGKITGIFDRRLGRNVLADRLPAPLPLPDGAVFTIAGWDEAFPNLEPHGELPTLGLAWRATPRCWLTENSLHTLWSLPTWSIERDITISGDALIARYTMTNLRDEPQPAIWAGHALYPLEQLTQAILPAGEMLPGPNCCLREVSEQLIADALSRRIVDTTPVARSWKFFLPAAREVQLHYHDARLTLTTDAPWWGIWLCRGAHGVNCLGIEPTNAPTDYLAEVKEAIPAGGKWETSWCLLVVPNP